MIFRESKNSITALVFFGVLVFFIAFVNIFRLSFNSFFILTLGIAVFLIALLKIDFALVILIFSMLLSPEFQVGLVKGRAIVVRIDDLVLMLVLLGWLARMALYKEIGLLKFTALNRPILIYFVICLISTLWGNLRGYGKLQISIFYLLKYLEYFLLYFMVVNNLRNITQVKVFVFSLLFVALIVSIYACVRHFQGMERVTAPFEGKAGEANTLGAYLILIILIATSFVLNTNSSRARIFSLLILLFALPAFIFTLSRGSWFAFVPAFIMLVIFTPRGKTLLIIVGLSTIVFSSLIFPRYFYERIDSTFRGGKEYNFLGKRIPLEESAATRVEILKLSFEKLKEEPILGHGVGTSMPIIDSQYARLLIDVGLLGSLVFVWMLFTIFINSFRNLKKLILDNFSVCLITGFLAGFVGLVIHGLGAETFIIIRVMEPFWFLAAIITMLPEICPQGSLEANV